MTGTVSGNLSQFEQQKDPAMAKGQKRSNREPKKPQQPKSGGGSGVSAALPARDAVGPGSDRIAARSGRK